ncbi:tryptophan--tRNA ligase [Pseudactinotalea sp. HY160]|uniref:tryptophan--tRNA ligase n=1 Tax=Pseudactinotalea sp. HY160 TaxID=2654490 RepID=UPI00128D2587|nr:tryptophan--tRNA ligase [Pseudactinotalea sp. HY160]MPV50316.1 tryptophan--tRNA ligase [Pseudactinotalea sp. HY160]
MPDAQPEDVLSDDIEKSLQRSVARSEEIEREIAADPSTFRVLTGDRPTGRLHLGHYLGTLANRVRLQDAGVETVLVVADYQVIMDRDDAGPLAERVRGLVTDYLAAGIDPERTTIFTHSSVPALNQLVLPFLSMVTDSELKRNPTVKAEHEATGGRPMSGLLFTYPVHQAADILFCKANLVPVGKDQLPHLEATRVVARRFNEKYARTFPLPEALLSRTANVLGLDGEKMSKSRGNTIELGMTADQTAKQFKRAVTDSDRHITYDPIGRPTVANLLQIAAACSGGDPARIAAEIGDGGGGGLKAVVTEAVNEHLAPLRARRLELEADPGYITSVLAEGNKRANEVADATLDEVRAAMGMVYGA